MTRDTLPIPVITIPDMPLNVEFREWDAIAAYLHAHPAALAMLPEVAERAREYFGPETSFALELDRDPEAGAYEELFVLIRTSLPPDDALERLFRLDREWWLHALERAEYGMNIDLESK